MKWAVYSADRASNSLPVIRSIVVITVLVLTRAQSAPSLAAQPSSSRNELSLSAATRRTLSLEVPLPLTGLTIPALCSPPRRPSGIRRGVR